MVALKALQAALARILQHLDLQPMVVVVVAHIPAAEHLLQEPVVARAVEVEIMPVVIRMELAQLVKAIVAAQDQQFFQTYHVAVVAVVAQTALDLILDQAAQAAQEH
jgi:hypothetical protein